MVGIPTYSSGNDKKYLMSRKIGLGKGQDFVIFVSILGRGLTCICLNLDITQNHARLPTQIWKMIRLKNTYSY